MSKKKERINQISVNEKCSGCESRLHFIEYEHTSTIPAVVDQQNMEGSTA